MHFGYLFLHYGYLFYAIRLSFSCNLAVFFIQFNYLYFFLQFNCLFHAKVINTCSCILNMSLLFPIKRTYPPFEELRNDSNIFFSDDLDINQNRIENCINARSAFLQKFSVLFRKPLKISDLFLFILFSFHFKKANIYFNTFKSRILTLVVIRLMSQ